MADANPTAAELRADFSYDPETGRIIRSSGQRPGYVVGYTAHNGYQVVTYRKKSLLAHRVAWCLATGAWPSGQIDHINGDRADNRLCNLRDVSPAENCRNQHKARRNSNTKVLGVTRTQSGRYMARMMVEGRRVYLGIHDSADDAQAAYQAARMGRNLPTD